MDDVSACTHTHSERLMIDNGNNETSWPKAFTIIGNREKSVGIAVDEVSIYGLQKLSLYLLDAIYEILGSI